MHARFLCNANSADRESSDFRAVYKLILNFTFMIYTIYITYIGEWMTNKQMVRMVNYLFSIYRNL